MRKINALPLFLIILLGSNFTHLAKHSIDKDVSLPTSFHTSIDHTDSIVQAAKEGIGSLNLIDNAAIDVTTASLGALIALLTEQKNDVAAIAERIEALNQKLRAIRDLLEAARDQSFEKFSQLLADSEILEQCNGSKRSIEEMFAKLIRELEAAMQEAQARNQSTTSLQKDLLSLKNKRDDMLKNLEVHCAKVLAEVRKLREGLRQTARARRIFTSISSDRLKAAQLSDLIQRNNRNGIAEFLKREGAVGDLVIIDAKSGTGPLLIFRVDALTHCLSGVKQCSGKSYSLTN